MTMLVILTTVLRTSRSQLGGETPVSLQTGTQLWIQTDSRGFAANEQKSRQWVEEGQKEPCQMWLENHETLILSQLQRLRSQVRVSHGSFLLRLLCLACRYLITYVFSSGRFLAMPPRTYSATLCLQGHK
jgi:hypothetical protein